MPPDVRKVLSDILAVVNKDYDSWYVRNEVARLVNSVLDCTNTHPTPTSDATSLSLLVKAIKEVASDTKYAGPHAAKLQSALLYLEKVKYDSVMLNLIREIDELRSSLVLSVYMQDVFAEVVTILDGSRDLRRNTASR